MVFFSPSHNRLEKLNSIQFNSIAPIAPTHPHQVGLKELSESLEAKIGGRVSPMIFLPGGGGAADDEDGGEGNAGLVQLTDPFLMNVYHRHSFLAWDPFRALQARFFPEGGYKCVVVQGLGEEVAPPTRRARSVNQK